MQKVKTNEIESVICTCYNFAHMLHENKLVFSQSEECNFFMYSIS